MCHRETTLLMLVVPCVVPVEVFCSSDKSYFDKRVCLDKIILSSTRPIALQQSHVTPQSRSEMPYSTAWSMHCWVCTAWSLHWGIEVLVGDPLILSTGRAAPSPDGQGNIYKEMHREYVYIYIERDIYIHTRCEKTCMNTCVHKALQVRLLFVGALTKLTPMRRTFLMLASLHKHPHNKLTSNFQQLQQTLILVARPVVLETSSSCRRPGSRSKVSQLQQRLVVVAKSRSHGEVFWYQAPSTMYLLLWCQKPGTKYLVPIKYQVSVTRQFCIAYQKESRLRPARPEYSRVYI